MTNKWVLGRALKFILICVWVVPLPLGFAEEQSELIRKAKQEGEVVLYTSIGIDLSRPVAVAFEKKYPSLRVKIQKGNAEGLYNRIIVEHLAGQVQADVVAMGMTPLLKDRGILAQFRSPEARSFPAKFKDPDGTWVGILGIYYVLGYNTHLVSADEVPRDWHGLTDPRWKGKIGMDPDEGRWYGAIIDYFGKEAAVKLMQGLGKQDIQWRKGHSLLAQLIVAGEFSLALVYAHRTQAIKKSGAPLDWVKTTKPIVVASNGMAVMNDAPHPAAARLFVDFFLSDRGHIPLRGDIIPRNSPFYPERLDLHPVAGHVMSRLLKLQKDFSRVMRQ
jgi:iron(III) transport system substrate-binding protein